MKLVLSPDQVAHKWAHQSQDSARNSGNTLFFYVNEIFSYGRHFCIAKHVNHNGKYAVLFTTRKYSNTTAKHISIVRNASSHLNKIYCPDPGTGTYANLEAFTREIKNELAGLPKAKKPEKYINAANATFAEAKKYAEFFDEKIPASMQDLIDSANNGEYKEYLSKEAERTAKEAKEAEARAVIEAKKQLAKWRKGETHRLYGRLNGRDYLRLNKKGRIETSQGIEIPVELAKRLYKKIAAIIKLGGCNGNCDFDILDFKVNEITKDYIRVGCHAIDLKEINKMAKQIGITI